MAGRAPHDDIRRWARRQLEGSVADNELDIHLTEDDVTLVLHSVTK
ncbi:hypothetical protein [Nakamurella flava]|nr:hypothetical protein [Nakamurella flava]